MTCEKFAQMLDNYENLTDEEKSLMSEHAAQCETCRREFEFMRSIINAVKTLPEMNVPDDFLENLNKRIDAEVKPAKRRSVAGHVRYNWQKYSAVAACLVLVAVIGANYNTLIDSMNGSDDGVISTVTTMSTPAPGTDSGNAPAPASTAAPAVDSETVVNSSDDSTGRRADITNGASDLNIRNDRTNRSSGSKDSGTNRASSNTTRSGSSTAVTNNVMPSAEYASPQITAASNAKATAETAPDSEPVADTAVVSESTADSGSETMTLPRSMYVESNSAPANVTGEESAAISDESTENPYAINPAAETGGYAATSVSGADDAYCGGSSGGSGGSTRARTSGGSSIGADIYSGEAEDNDLGYALNPNNMIMVKGEDFATAFDIICRYASDSYSNYFMVTSDDIDNMLAALDEAGVRYHDNIAVDTDKITFRISIE